MRAADTTGARTADRSAAPKAKAASGAVRMALSHIGPANEIDHCARGDGPVAHRHDEQPVRAGEARCGARRLVAVNAGGHCSGLDVKRTAHELHALR